MKTVTLTSSSSPATPSSDPRAGIGPFLRTHGTILLVIVCGIGFAFLLFFSVRAQITHHLKQEFEWVAQDRHRAIQKGLESALGAVHELNDLFHSSPAIQAQTFQRVASMIRLRYPEIESLQWVPVASLPSPNPEQARIAFQEPSEGSITPIGFDHYADLDRRKLLEEARDTGKLVVSGRIPLSRELPPQRLGFLAAQPVYHPVMPHTTVVYIVRALD
jgi:CHASE1-domain containing sensor protein